MTMDEASTSRVYDLWSKVYDRSFGLLVARRQARAVEQMRLRPGDRVLDLGVGTGMTLGLYPRDVTVMGMDLSAGMLSRAADKCQDEQLDHCRLVRGDALLPPFAPASFDHVMISHTISVVSDPAGLLNWATRLLKPGGQIILLNHFQSAQPVVATIEKVLNPLVMKLGWRSDLSLEAALRGTQLNVEYCFKTNLIDLWRIVVLSPQRRHQPSRRVPAEFPDQSQVALPRLAVGSNS